MNCPLNTPDARTIVITGATTGMGRALADELIARGMSVWGCGRTAEAIAQLNALRPGCFRVLDVQHATDLTDWAAALEASGHVPDLLINNAAIMHWLAPFCEIPAEEFDRTVDINLKGAARVLRAFLPAMIRRGRGLVVNVSSGWGRFAGATAAGYCAAKFGLEGLSASIAKELPPGVGMVTLSPGSVNTGMTLASSGHYHEGNWSPEEWVRIAAPLLLGLTPALNGRMLSIGRDGTLQVLTFSAKSEPL